MSVSSQLPSNRKWLRRLLTGQPHQVIGDPEAPYLRRWYLIPRNPLLNVYLHQFLASDDDRALHDHPWWFFSLILKGGYTEVTEAGAVARSGVIGGRYGGWNRWDRTIAFRPAAFRHRVELWTQLCETGRDDQRPRGGPLVRTWRHCEIPCWTVIVTGPRTREWGFWCKELVASRRGVSGWWVDRFVPWTEFGSAGCGESL